MKARRARRGSAAGSRAEHDTSRYVQPKVKAQGTRVGMRSQASKGGRMSPRKHR